MSSQPIIILPPDIDALLYPENPDPDESAPESPDSLFPRTEILSIPSNPGIHSNPGNLSTLAHQVTPGSPKGRCPYCNREYTIRTLNKYGGYCGRCFPKIQRLGITPGSPLTNSAVSIPPSPSILSSVASSSSPYSPITQISRTSRTGEPMSPCPKCNRVFRDSVLQQYNNQCYNCSKRKSPPQILMGLTTNSTPVPLQGFQGHSISLPPLQRSQGSSVYSPGISGTSASAVRPEPQIGTCSSCKGQFNVKTLRNHGGICGKCEKLDPSKQLFIPRCGVPGVFQCRGMPLNFQSTPQNPPQNPPYNPSYNPPYNPPYNPSRLMIPPVMIPIRQGNTSIPMQSIPMQSIPMQSIPMQSIPMQSIPMQTLPMQSTPMQSIPMQSIPMQTLPMQSTPMQSIPMQSTPMQTIPMQTIPKKEESPKK
jgi:hypothetical protein